jgi:hypothetical protein
LRQGIGIRYSPNGIRAAGLFQTENSLKISGVAAGIPSRGIETFLNDNGFLLEDVFITVGLCAGDFLSSYINGIGDMTPDEINEILTWEINRKIISGASEYSMDFLNLENSGLLFATRNKIISSIKEELPGAIIDVEPVALFNSWENSGEKTTDPVIVISVEAEGISSVSIENSMPVSVESFVIRDDNVSGVLADIDYDGIKNQPADVEERFLNYISESILRQTALGEDKSKIMPSKILITGGGAYFGNLAKKIGDKFEIATAIFDPFGETIAGLNTLRHEFQELRSAFSSPIGLALRSLAEE